MSCLSRCNVEALGPTDQPMGGACLPENKVCLFQGGERRGAVVCGTYLEAALPRSPFLAKSSLMGRQQRWLQVVN